MAITSEEVNYLVYRYLQESGFAHSAFTFACESLVHKAPIEAHDVPAGALISFLQKGLQYLEIEANVQDVRTALAEGPSLEEDFAVLTPNELLTNSVPELRELVSKRREQNETLQGNRSLAAMQMDGAREVLQHQVRVLRGHTSEVFICAWSPSALTLASGSGDSTVRLWDLSQPDHGDSSPAVLEHWQQPQQPSKDVTVIDWRSDGAMLASGSVDGNARIWSSSGELIRTLQGHKGPIFSLRWSRKGNLLLSGSADKTAVVWDAQTGKMRQQWDLHEGATLDVDWRDGRTFATSSQDATMCLCRLGEAAPTQRFTGHQGEVNAIKWDPSGKILASCSDDATAKLWSSDSAQCAHDLTLHSKEVYTLKWRPPGSPSSGPLLATASFDHSVRLWNGETGACVACLREHSQPVYSLAFSPDGSMLASGSFDRFLHVWRTADGACLRSFQGSSGIFEVSWSMDGHQIAGCSVDCLIWVLDLQKS